MRQNILRGYRFLKRRWYRWQGPEARALRQLKRSLGHLPRHQPGHVCIWGWELEYVDAASCLSAFDFTVVRNWLDFGSSHPSPRIIDGGANIGISVLNYKRLFPQARITAFEPDPDICAVLRRNLKTNRAEDVEVIEAALWDTETELCFESDGADGGRIDLGQRGSSSIWVRTHRLVDYLNESVDMLKLDIEGAEGRVILDCGNHLRVAKNLVLEYHTFAGGIKIQARCFLRFKLTHLCITSIHSVTGST